MISYKKVHTIVFDFDGVFTNNKVLVSDNGNETVICDRGEGLGLELLRKFCNEEKHNINLFILSREKNNVVSSRAKKLSIECFQGIDNKLEFLQSELSSEGLTNDGLVYLGNDLNDLEVMDFAGFSVAPIDSHQRILSIADEVIEKKGGYGFVREFIERFIDIESMSDKKIINLLRK